MVGDGDADVQTALNAGVSSICVLWGYRSKEQLEKVGGTVFINNPTELLDIIK
jgi:phosphoglycolate phosphatase